MEQKKKVNAPKETICGIMPRVGVGKVISPAEAYFKDGKVISPARFSS